MGHNYMLNVAIQLVPNVYEACLKHIVKEYKGEWDQHPDGRKDLQFVWVDSDSGKLFFQRFPVITRGREKEEYYISQNIIPLKSGEKSNLYDFQEEIVDAKSNMEEFVRKAGFDEVFRLDKLLLTYSEQGRPYTK